MCVPNFSTIGRVVLEIWQRDCGGLCTWHVRTCGCIPPLTNANPLADGSLRAYQISAQSAVWLSRYNKGILGGCARATCARADVSPFWLAYTPSLMGHYVCTKFEHDSLSGCQDIAKGFLGCLCTWHVCTCGCTPFLASAHPLFDGSLCTYQI